MKKNILEDWHLKAIKDRIDESLRIRCINVTTTLKVGDETRGGGQRLLLSSTPFNTVPVIHSEITIEDFGGSVSEGERVTANEQTIPIKTFYIRVCARYDGNGETLFAVSGEVQEIGNDRTALFFDHNTGNIRRDKDVFYEWDLNKKEK